MFMRWLSSLVALEIWLLSFPFLLHECPYPCLTDTSQEATDGNSWDRVLSILDELMRNGKEQCPKKQDQ